MPGREIDGFVERHLVLEVLVYGVEMGVGDELTYRMLVALALILECVGRARKIARGLGVMRVMGRLGQCGNVRVTTVARDIMKMYNNQSA